MSATFLLTLCGAARIVRAMSDTFQKVSAALDGLRDELVACMQQLLAIPALAPENGGDGEWDKSRALKKILEPIVDEIVEYPCPDPRVSNGQRPNIAAYLRGRTRGPRLWILSHLDVVPAGELSAWKTPPFEGTVRDGKIFGRGAEDNHQAIVSSLYAAKALRVAGVTPPHDVALLFLSDEEVGNEHGIHHILATTKLFSPDDLIIVPDGGWPAGDQIEIAEKGVLWLKFTVHGKSAHASTPRFGHNACRAGAELIVALQQLHARFPASNLHFDEEPQSTFEPTKRWGNDVSFNVIPNQEIFGMDCRLLPGTNAADVQKVVAEICRDVEQRCQVAITVEVDHVAPAAPATPADAPVVRAVQSAVQVVHRLTPKLVGVGGQTFSTPLREAGWHTAVYSKLENSLHQPNEYCVIQNIIDDARVFAHVACENRE